MQLAQLKCKGGMRVAQMYKLQQHLLRQLPATAECTYWLQLACRPLKLHASVDKRTVAAKMYSFIKLGRLSLWDLKFLLKKFDLRLTYVYTNKTTPADPNHRCLVHMSLV